MARRDPGRPCTRKSKGRGARCPRVESRGNRSPRVVKRGRICFKVYLETAQPYEPPSAGDAKDEVEEPQISNSDTEPSTDKNLMSSVNLDVLNLSKKNV